MEIVGALVFLFTCYVALRVGSLAVTLVRGGRFRPYRLLATRRGGRYESRGLYAPPTVSFMHRDSLVRVGLAPNNADRSGPPRTRVVGRFARGIPFRLELAPTARPAPPQPPRGTRPIRLGIAALDRDFTVRTNDPEIARTFLKPGAVAAILDLQSMVHAGGMLVSIDPERLLIQVDRDLGRSVDSLDLAVANALILLDGLLEEVGRRLTAGVDIVESAEDGGESRAEPPVCKVCGELIGAGPVVVCSRCGTPHHRDCWEFVGGCSIYGCTGRTGDPG